MTARAEALQQWRIANPKRVMVHNARQRARKAELPCTVEAEDFELTEVCPCCETPYELTGRAASATSPSLDRIIPSLGYLPDNVVVVCLACNVRKNDASPAELYRIADYFYELIKERGL